VAKSEEKWLFLQAIEEQAGVKKSLLKEQS